MYIHSYFRLCIEKRYGATSVPTNPLYVGITLSKVDKWHSYIVYEAIETGSARQLRNDM